MSIPNCKLGTERKTFLKIDFREIDLGGVARGTVDRERERERERETSISCPNYSCTHWLILVCALTRDCLLYTSDAADEDSPV